MRRNNVNTASTLRSRDLVAGAVRRAQQVAVSFLTPFRRKADASGPWMRTGIASMPLVFMLLPAWAAQWQSVDDIGRRAEAFLAVHMGIADERTTLRAHPLDARLQLPHCSEPLDAFLQRGTTIGSRVTVGVRCNGAKPWKVYVAVDVIVSESVLVAARTLPSGHVLASTDLVPARRDVARLTSGYLQSSSDLIGKRLKHGLIEGRVLTPNMLTADVVIHRGQSVTLTIRSKSLNISTEGKALMDGSVNQRIRVENTLSRRIVEGIVRSPEHVEVLVF